MAEKRNMNGKKPIAIGIEIGCRDNINPEKLGGFRVKYKCPKCGKPLCGELGSSEKYCHSCGQKIDWRVVTYLNSTQSNKIESAGSYVQDDIVTSYIKLVNSINLTKELDYEVCIAEFENAMNYLGIEVCQRIIA